MTNDKLEAIRRRDQSPYMASTAWLSQSEEDRRALLAAYDALETNALRELAGMEAAWRNACERGDKAVARLAEVERLLQEVYDGRQSLMSVGLVYRIGHTLDHRPPDSASHRENERE